jgi:hypothetical protein
VQYEPGSFPGMIDKATDIMMPEIDWALVTEVCDKASQLTDPKEIALGVRAARKRIQSEYHKVVMFGLIVIDALVKNNEKNFLFLQHMAEEKMMKSLVRLVNTGQKGGHDNMEAMEKVLSMIQAWGEGYHAHQDKGVRLFVQTYHELRGRNIPFPRPTSESVGIFTPPSTAPAVIEEENIEVATVASLKTAAPKPAPIDHHGARVGDAGGGGAGPSLPTIANTISLLEQSLDAADTVEEIKSSALIQDMVVHLNKYQADLVAKLQSATVADDKTLHKILHMNDSIHVVLNLHKTLLEKGPKKKAPVAAAPSKIAAPKMQSKPKSNRPDASAGLSVNSLDDFAFDAVPLTPLANDLADLDFTAESAFPGAQQGGGNEQNNPEASPALANNDFAGGNSGVGDFKKPGGSVMVPSQPKAAIDLDSLYKSQPAPNVQTSQGFGLGGSSSVSAAFSSANFQFQQNARPNQTNNNSPFQNAFPQQNGFAQQQNVFSQHNPFPQQSTFSHQNPFPQQAAVQNDPFGVQDVKKDTNPFANFSQGSSQAQLNQSQGTNRNGKKGGKSSGDALFGDLVNL